MSFKMSLKAARVQGELTVLEMAKALGIGKDKYLKWEKNPEEIPSVFHKIIAEVTGVPEELIFFSF